MRVGLLECDHVSDRYRGIDGDYADMFESLLGHDLISYDAVNGKLPERADECDAWLATGSRHSVYDEAEWISRLLDFVRQVQTAGTAFVGICFGHQLLAHAVGGRTEKASVGWGVGAIDTWVEPTSSDELLLYMHQDQVVALPDGATVIGRTEHCPIAMLELGPMLGIQAHPEFSATYVEALLDARVDRIGAEVTARAKRSLERVGDAEDAARIGRMITSFLETHT